MNRNIKIQRGILAVLILLLVLNTVGCGRKKEPSPSPEATTAIKGDTGQGGEEVPDDILIEQMVDRAVGKMSLEEKVGQLFVVCTDSLDFNAETELTKEAAANIRRYQPGGVIFFSFNLKNREQTADFIKGMQAESPIPLFIAVDEEGGRVARIANSEKMGTTRFPSMSEIGKKGDPSEAGKVGKTIAEEIGSLGFNLDFAPVCDITTNDTNTEIGDRSFGSDPELVSDMVTAAVKGLQDHGVCATLKHFPGQGDTGEDTHRGYVNLDTSIDRLRQVEFVPFEAGIRAGADLVMVSHVAVKNITQNEVPASLSSLMVGDILRGELQFDNIIITDAMNMKVITKFYDPAQAALLAIEAGNDMILMPDDFAEAYNGILEALNEGDLSEKTVNQAVERILAVKIRRGIIPADSELLQ